jgi:hypothetical protein
MGSPPLSWNMYIRTMMTDAANEYLKSYVTERLPNLVPGVFEGAPDQPSFTVDQHYRVLHDPSYKA